MAISRSLLNEGEEIIFSTRTHYKALLVPGFLLLLVLVVAAWLTSLVSGVWLWVVWIAAGALIAVFSLWPLLNWLAATYTVTTRRLITRNGVLTRRGHDIPLNRISDVSYEHGVIDRILGCGTLIVSDASTHGRVPLHDIPRVEVLHKQLSDLLFNGSAGPDKDVDGRA